MPSSPTSTQRAPKPEPSTAFPSSSAKVDPLEAKKVTDYDIKAALQAKIAALETQIRETEEKQREVHGQLKTKDAQATVKAHIKLLHDYNEIRDVGQGLMGIIADSRGVRVKHVYQDFDVGEGD
ncbi:MAG: hypothetical protein ALECFALPRED_009344 [Alectoria fallacina]|uniref:Swi5-domain-containing protein n=1 Tax=Alectoria fallacina TaxID=1903189 RepID=A0A8H3F1N7_9LECA|nr:MAG: hypothetical protein ALECFALPRED_009344 [Alectoria fallacina]